jgi:tellurite resistance protein TerC
MAAPIEITTIHWVGFIVGVLFLLAMDLGVFHRKAREVSFKEAVGWTVLWVSLSLLFAGLLVPLRGREEAIEFLTGYLIELSLSMDNVFVIALIFAYFRVPHMYQHRVLFWGILGALIMRGVLIGIGAVLIAKFHWMLYGFGLFLIYTGWHMARSDDDGVHPESNWVVQWARRFFPLTRDNVGQRFVVRGREAECAEHHRTRASDPPAGQPASGAHDR